MKIADLKQKAADIYRRLFFNDAKNRISIPSPYRFQRISVTGKVVTFEKVVVNGITFLI